MTIDPDYEQTIHGELHYKGDVRHTFENNKPLGPNYNRELIWPVFAMYDEEKDMTTLQCSKNPPPGLYG